MRVRPAEITDAEAIATVHVRSWQATYRGRLPDDYLRGLSIERRTETWREILARSDRPGLGAFVVEVDDGIVGFVHTGPSRDANAPTGTGEITALYLAPEHWGRGGGRLLLDVALTNLRAAGYRRATLWVLESNAAARRFYEISGWAADGATRTEDRGSFVLAEVRYGRATGGYTAARP
ncbi:MAG: GNAT family N-acetyltransferase [Actinomycetota bacterium]|nr:GNAT family N-acetyltransferase [Actinomycetota bacterium]